MSQFERSRRSVLSAFGTAMVAPAVVSALTMVPQEAQARGDAAVHLAEATAALEKTVEELRIAMLAGDEKSLSRLLHDRLTYSHSDGHQQTKFEVLQELSGNHVFQTLTLSAQTVDVVGTAGIVRHVFDAVNNLPGGGTSTAHIKVLQVWLRSGPRWTLLARASTPLKA